MRNILETARQLNNLKVGFDEVLKWGFPEPKEIDRLLKKLHAVEEAHNDVNLPGLEALKKKVEHAYRIGKLSALARRDKKNYPFLLDWASKNNSELCRLLLKEIKQVDSMQLLRREIYIYFNEYDSGKYVNELKNDILKKLRSYDKHNLFLLSMKNNVYFFAPDRIGDVRERCVERGIFAFFNSLHFPKSFLRSRYVGKVIKGIFDSDFRKLNLKSKIELFENSYKIFKDVFSGLLPNIYASLIMQIEEDSGAQRTAFIDAVRPKALSFMGDPRLGEGRYGRWSVAGTRPKETFIKWISRYDLDAFFEIIGNSLSTAKDRNMWLYRDKFWKAYKDDIQMVWVCFGASGRFLAQNREMSYGQYIGGDKSKSCIMIVIGDYVFIERSHNGKLKVWEKKHCPFKIGALSISETTVDNTRGLTHLEDGGPPKDDWQHNSSVTYNWQKKVGSFIAQYMHVIKTVSDWRV